MFITLISFFYLSLLFFLFLYFRNLKKQVKRADKKTLHILHSQENLLHSLHLLTEKISRDHVLPPSLISVPFADQTGLVLSVKQLSLPPVGTPHVASIVSSNKGYDVFFRYNTQKDTAETPLSHLGCINLTPDFEPMYESFRRIDTKSTFSEDARCFTHLGRQFLVYNDIYPEVAQERTICIAELDSRSSQLKYTTPFRTQSNQMEKNWTPFSFGEQIFFLYSLDPQVIFELPDPQKNNLIQTKIFPHKSLWPEKWGKMRGGTPAILVDGEYLSFFHSSFKDEKGIIWYVMGAYTFASTFPFQITGISPHPILFNNIYHSSHDRLANPKVRVIYPTGIVYEKRNNRELITVSCGENDSFIKIITIDKKMLFSSLKRIAPQKALTVDSTTLQQMSTS